MLKKLEILNGEIDLEFNEFVNTYTVRVKKDVNYLDFLYETTNDCAVVIRDNNLLENDSIVYIDVYGEEVETYKFIVYKEDEKIVNRIDDFIQKLELDHQKEVPLLKLQVLNLSIFIALILLFILIFKKKHKKTKY